MPGDVWRASGPSPLCAGCGLHAVAERHAPTAPQCHTLPGRPGRPHRLQALRAHGLRLVHRQRDGGGDVVHELCLCHTRAPGGGDHAPTPAPGREVSQGEGTRVAMPLSSKFLDFMQRAAVEEVGAQARLALFFPQPQPRSELS